MSDTPRTDACFDIPPKPDDSAWTKCEFSRTLERELSASAARVKELESENADLKRRLGEPPDRCTGKEVATLLGIHQCPKCGADRTKEPCKNWRKNECVLVGTAQS
jgi:hypothetical protein